MAAHLGGGAGVQRPEPGAGRARGRRALLPARDAAVPLRERHPHGPRPQLHDGGRRHARAPAQRLEGRAADGLGRVRAAGRERCDPRGRPPARDHRAQHQDDPRADEAPGLGDRLGPRGLVARAGLLPLDAVAVPPLLREGPRLPARGSGQLVPERPDGGRERVHRRRPLRALRRAHRAAEHDAVVLQDDGVRRRAARVRPAARRRLARPLGRRSATGSAARKGAEILFRVDELDIDLPVFTTRPDTLFGATFFVVAPEHPFVEAHASEEASEYAQARGREAHRGARRRDREDGRLHRPLRDEPGQRRAAADLGRRLRADGLRHGRDHGRAGARRARPRVRRDVRPADRAR